MNNTQRRLHKELYAHIMSEKSKDAHKKRKEQGIHSATAPLGYKWIRIGSDRRGYSQMVVNEETKKIVQDIFALYNTGAYSFRLLEEEIQKRYGKSPTRSGLARILSYEFYNGYSNGLLHAYDRIIDDTTFAQTQKILKSRTSNKKKLLKVKEYPLRAIFSCGECGCSITPEKHKNIVYYHCTQSMGKHNAPWINQDILWQELCLTVKDILNLEELPKTQEQMVALRTALLEKFDSLLFNQNKTISYTIKQIIPAKEIEIAPEKAFDELTKAIALVCLESKTIEEIAQKLQKPIDIIQDKIIDMQLEGLIDEQLNGSWKTL